MPLTCCWASGQSPQSQESEEGAVPHHCVSEHYYRINILQSVWHVFLEARLECVSNCSTNNSSGIAMTPSHQKAGRSSAFCTICIHCLLNEQLTFSREKGRQGAVEQTSWHKSRSVVRRFILGDLPPAGCVPLQSHDSSELTLLVHGKRIITQAQGGAHSNCTACKVKFRAGCRSLGYN